MPKIKKKSTENKLHKTKRGGDCPKTPAFSFSYLTKNKKYNFDFFSDKSDKGTVLENLYYRLIEICNHNWLRLIQMPKEQGIETLSADQICFEPANKKLMPDEKVIILRMKGYAKQDARIIGIREDGCPILHIIGFDFDFSAYKH